MIKRFFQFAVPLMCFAILLGCNLYDGKRPDANPDERWISEDLQMYFTWTEDAGSHWGEIKVNGVITKVRVLFDYGYGVDVDRFTKTFSSRNRLFSGECEFSKNELVIVVTNDSTNFWGGNHPTITLVRHVRQEDGSFAPAE